MIKECDIEFVILRCDDKYIFALIIICVYKLVHLSQFKESHNHIHQSKSTDRVFTTLGGLGQWSQKALEIPSITLDNQISNLPIIYITLNYLYWS